ncbi:MAG: hypothetical protein GC168_03585 [Candidatus Hydrogenedens sp.]|nr:hypothetical protein [Candidatus Hydrogenedens sp.]
MAFSFDSLISGGSGAPKSDTISLLQFGPGFIARLRIRPKAGGGFDVLSYDRERGGWSAEDGSLREALKAFVSKHALTEDSIYSILPRYDITTRMLTLPSQDNAEIASMIMLNAEEHVPYAIDELSIQHLLMRKLPSGESSVMAVFARNSVVEEHIATLAAAGIEPRQVLLSTVCLAAAAAAAGPGEPQRWALAHLGAGGLEILVLNQKRVVYCRGVAMNHDWSSDTAESHEMTDELATEIRGSLSVYRRESEDGEGVEQIYFSSDYATVTTISEELMHDIGRETAPAAWLEKLLPGQAAPEGYTPVLLGAALAAAGDTTYHLNLLPERMHQARRMSGMRDRLLQGGIVAAVALIMLGALYFQRVYQYQSYIDELQAQVDELAPQAQGIAQKQEQLRIIGQQVRRDGNVLELLASIVAGLPDDKINILRFSYERESGIDVYGRTQTVDEVSAFASNLRQAGTGALSMLRTAHQMYVLDDSEREQLVRSYRIAIPVTPEDEEDDREASDAGTP